MDGEVQGKEKAKKAAYIKLVECMDEEEKCEAKLVVTAAKMQFSNACMSSYGTKVEIKNCLGLQKRERKVCNT